MGEKDNSFLCVKYTFFAVNVIFWLVGCAILAVGIWLLVAHGPFATLTPSYGFLSATSILIAAGCVVLIIGFFGCCGAILENQCMLFTYFILVLLVFILEIVAGILAFVFRNELLNVIEDELTLGIKTKYNIKDEDQKGLVEAWDIVQEEFECCGVRNYTDWFLSSGAKIPDSCCIFPSPKCGENSQHTNIHIRGCLSSVKLWLQDKLVILGVVAIAIAVVQILGMAAAMALFCCLRREKMAFA